MDEKVLFTADYIRGGCSFTALCARYGISRKTGYKWINRYHQAGMDGLSERSRQPKQSPLKTPYPIRKAIIELRKRHSKMGAKKLRILLQQQFPNEVIPSKTTLYHILQREGLITSRRKRQRVPPFPQPFAPVRAPNELWSADFKGQFKTHNGIWCYPLTIMDHDSRYLLGCQGLEGTGFIDTQTTFTRLFKEYGLPERIRTDNGTPFASRAVGGLSRLAAWWIRLGILPERIKPGCPQQNGRHERMHRTLKQAVAKPPAANFKAQQRCFDQFRHDYNHSRPHEALGQKTPASCYQPSPRVFPDKLPELCYPDYYDVHTVRTTGVVYWHNGQVYVSHILKGENVGLNQVDDGIWDIYFGPVRLGGFNEREVKGHAVSYWTLKV
jgi:transposase InsO family protein